MATTGGMTDDQLIQMMNTYYASSLAKTPAGASIGTSTSSTLGQYAQYAGASWSGGAYFNPALYTPNTAVRGMAMGGIIPGNVYPVREELVKDDPMPVKRSPGAILGQINGLLHTIKELRHG